jgi:methyl halide transferase
MSLDWSRWEQRYLDGLTGWERRDPNPAFLAWRAGGVPAPGRVLVPCAGRSAEPLLLAQAGFDVTVVDFAPSATLAQREVLGGHAASVIEADLLSWQPEQLFDAIYDQTALCALDPVRHADYEALLYDWLRPGGLLLMLFMQTGRAGGPPFDCPIDVMRGLFPMHRWQWPERVEPLVAHPNGLLEQPAVLVRLA